MSPVTSRPTRRAIARGAAWTVPVVAVGAAAPSFAASLCASLPPFSTADGWSLTTSGNGVGGGAGFSSGTFFTTADAPRSQTYVATATHGLVVVAGTTYTFTYSYTAFTSNPRPMSQALLVDGGVIPGSTFSTVTSGTSGSRTVVWTAPASTTVTFGVRNSVSGPFTGSTSGDDITVSAITVSCS